MSCNCRSCEETSRYFKIINQLSDDDKKFMNDVYERLSHDSFDRDYYWCILNGQWPTSVEQLTRALELAKEKRKILYSNSKIREIKCDKGCEVTEGFLEECLTTWEVSIEGRREYETTVESTYICKECGGVAH